MHPDAIHEGFQLHPGMTDPSSIFDHDTHMRKLLSDSRAHQARGGSACAVEKQVSLTGIQDLGLIVDPLARGLTNHSRMRCGFAGVTARTKCSERGRTRPRRAR